MTAPIFPDAIQRGEWSLAEDFAWDVRAHQWHSEYARPAVDHDYYAQACEDARLGRNAGGIVWDPVWMRTWADVEAVRQGCWFDARKGEHAVAFFRLLRHSKGAMAGKPFVLLPWQKFDVVMPLFGWQRPDEMVPGGVRRFAKSLIEIPKKNGKSTLCAGISLYLLVADGEAGAEVYNVAAAIDQAKIVFKEALRMAKACPYLVSRITPRPSVKQIEHESSNSEYLVLSSDSATAEGKNISGLVFDELHAQKDRDLFEALTYGGDARSQPLFLSITTAGEYNELAIGWEEHEYGRRNLAGEPGPGEDISYFAYIRCVVEDEGADEHEPVTRWTKEQWWYRANPGLGVTLDLAKFRQAQRTAQDTPSKQNGFKRYRLNVWVQAAEAAFNMDDWTACLWDGDEELAA